MSPKALIAAALLASCARHPHAPMTPNSPGSAAADAAAGPAVPAATPGTAPNLPLDVPMGLDEAAADILKTGKYETATFALG